MPELDLPASDLAASDLWVPALSEPGLPAQAIPDAAHWQLDGVAGALRVGTTALNWRLCRSARRRTLGLTLTPDELRIHAPQRTARGEIERYVRSQADWLARACARLQQRHPVAPAPLTGSRYLGQMLVWQVRDAALADVRRVGRTLQIAAPPGIDPAGLVRQWLQARASEVLVWRLMRQARRASRRPVKIGLSDARSLWGSCTRSGTIRLNWRLAQAPLALIDYVAAHELAHLVHLDHSPRFWAEVARLCPDPLAQRAALRRMGAELFRL